MSSSDNKSPILVFLCNWAPYRCYMDMGNSGRSPVHPVYPVKVMCAGRVDPSILLHAFEKGAEGVMVIGCRDKECQYGPGPGQVRKIEERIKAMLHILGLGSERFLASTYASHERDRLLEEMNAFVKRIRKLGRSPLAPHPGPARPVQARATRLPTPGAGGQVQGRSDMTPIIPLSPHGRGLAGGG